MPKPSCLVNMFHFIKIAKEMFPFFIRFYFWPIDNHFSGDQIVKDKAKQKKGDNTFDLSHLYFRIMFFLICIILDWGLRVISHMIMPI